MISAKEPFSGGFDGAAAGREGPAFVGVLFADAPFVVVPGPLLRAGPGDAGLGFVVEAGLGTFLGVPNGAGALLLGRVLDFEPSGRDGRGSWSSASALRFIPPLAFPFAAGREVGAAGLGSTFLTVEDVAGGAGR